MILKGKGHIRFLNAIGEERKEKKKVGGIPYPYTTLAPDQKELK